MRRTPILIALAVLVAVVAACGGVDQAEEPTTPPRTPTSTSATTQVTEGQLERVEESDEVAAVAEAATVDVSDGAELVVVAGFFGDPSNNLGGYAVKGEEITSPGPTIRVRKGDSVTITFENDHFYEGGTPFLEAHNFTVVADRGIRVSEMEPLWDAHVGGFGEPNLEAGESGSVTFEAEAAGTFYYVCALGDHIGHGMWGQFVVEEAP